jgi:hypothetical protein
MALKASWMFANLIFEIPKHVTIDTDVKDFRKSDRIYKSDHSNYRAITLIPVISKVLEGVIHILYEDFFLTNSLQYGFKRSVGCADAVFTRKSVISNFIGGCSSVYAAALDVKAFDKVIHSKFYNSLLAAGIPTVTVKVLCCWYSELFAYLFDGTNEQQFF